MLKAVRSIIKVTKCSFSVELKYQIWKANQASRIEKFKGKHFNDDCFIIGNGPSLNNTDLSFLKDYHTFGLNKIFLIFKKIEIPLSYFVSTNPLVANNNIEEISRINCPKFFSHYSKNYYDKTHDSYFLFIKPLHQFTEDLTLGIHHGFTVTFAALQIAYYMGFKNVFLIGIDHNFKQSGKPGELQLMNTFDPNHFDPHYFKGQEWHLADLENSEISYLMAKKKFEANGCSIFDATINGKLNIFDKVPYTEALRFAKKKSG